MRLHQVLPRCDPHVAALTRRLYGHQMAWGDEPGSTLRWQWVRGAVAALQLRLDVEGELMELQWLDDLPATWPDELSHPAVPTELRHLMLATLLAPLWQRLEAQRGRPLRITLLDVHAQVPAWDAHAALGWALDSPLAGPPLHGMIRARTPAGWARLAEALPSPLAVAWGHDAQRLGLSVHCAPIPLSAAECARLEAGDVLLLDPGVGSLERLAARVQLSGRWLPGLRGVYLGHALLITQTQARDDAAWIDSSRRTLSMTSPLDANVDTLPVWVDVELARLPLSVGQVRSLSIGQVFELDAPHTPSQVVLSCGGQRLGLAELVVVGERLGVRVLELSTPATWVAQPTEGVTA